MHCTDLVQHGQASHHRVPTPRHSLTLNAPLPARLKHQMTTGVRWRETMANLTVGGIDTLVEIGPGNVLSGLAKRAMKGVTISQIASSGDLGL